MQEICTVTALGENALTSISYAKVALQMAETQNGCRKIGLGYSGSKGMSASFFKGYSRAK